MTIYQKMLLETKRLDEKMIELQQQLKGLPPGRLLICKNGKNTKWYHQNDGKTSYLPKSQRPLAEKLAKRRYVTNLLKELGKERKAIDYYLRHHETITNQAECILNNPNFLELLAPSFIPHSEKLQNWLNESYRMNPNYPENLTHKTITGQYVRSKSESLIAMCLAEHQIPFRYECEIDLDGTILYPDFTLLHPRTLEVYYWEHFGMMDSPSYVTNVNSKIQLYTSHDIIPSVNLITSYETKEHPLDLLLVNQMIEYYFD